MPNKANFLVPSGNPVFAKDVLLSQRKGPFFCCTNGCNAQMVLVNGGDPERAYFRSKDTGEHLNKNCIKNALVFIESDYNENLYDNNFTFESILGMNHNDMPAVQRGTSGARAGVVGGSRNLRIHTVAKLVAMCLNRRKKGAYNGVPIDDILADEDNYERYRAGIRGYKVVEVSFYKKVYNECALLFNYPADNRGKSSWVKVVFPPEMADFFWQQYRKCKSDKSHSEVLYIAGDWRECHTSDGHRFPHSYCMITSRRQIYWATI